ncbi:hypothetical protein [Sorangium sp. So ce394]|uniref:hypothetical protein n=1 Tax=Sorangium sp. So ce394 TaxID=3133310 RepID=UPI003F5B41E2
MGRSRWDEQAGSAVEAWTDSVLGANLPPDERRRAARRFSSIARQFVMGGPDALKALERRLSRSSGDARTAIARLLAAIPDTRAASLLLHAYRPSQRREIDPEPLAYLGIAAPLPREAWDDWALAEPAAHGPLLRALLRLPTPEGDALLARILADGDLETVRAALYAAERWMARDALQKIADGPSRRHADRPAWTSVDLRVDAAFLLGLRGDEAGARRLVELADPARGVEGAHACVRLAWLGLASAVPRTAKLLSSPDAFAAGLALDAAAALRSAALVEPLLALASSPDAPVAIDGASLADDALRVVSGIVGAPSEEWAHAGAPCDVSVEAYRTRARALDPELRYRAGEPLTLHHLVHDLVSPHAGPQRAAAASLRAATGEDHGYRPDDDLIANHPAIEAWSARAEGPAPAPPGGWGWQGRAAPGPGAVQ